MLRDNNKGRRLLDEALALGRTRTRDEIINEYRRLQCIVSRVNEFDQSHGFSVKGEAYLDEMQPKVAGMVGALAWVLGVQEILAEECGKNEHDLPGALDSIERNVAAAIQHSLQIGRNKNAEAFREKLKAIVERSGDNVDKKALSDAVVQALKWCDSDVSEVDLIRLIQEQQTEGEADDE